VHATWRKSRKQIIRSLGNLNKESVPSKPLFLAMIERNLYTIDSQEGRAYGAGPVAVDAVQYAECIQAALKEGIPKDSAFESRVDELYAARGGAFTEAKTPTTMERAYVEGAMPVRLAHVFAYFVNSRTDKLALVSSNDAKASDDGGLPIPVTFQRINTVSNPLFARELAGEVPNTTHIWTTRVRNESSLPKALRRLHGGEIAVVTCVDLKHGRLASKEDGLFTDVLKCLDLAKVKVDPADYFALPTT
jgi:hypothetical protein